jgi:hypothetical protein
VATVIGVREVQEQGGPQKYVEIELEIGGLPRKVLLTPFEAVELTEKLAELVTDRGWA